MKKRAVLLCGLLCALLLTACGGKSTATGWYLATVEGSQETGPLIVRDDTGSYITEALADKSETHDLFDGLESGDRIRITYDCPDSSPWPGVNWVYKCELLEEGSLDDVPEEALTAMEETGYDFGRHVHAPAAEPETVADPVSGYCGNTVTKVTLDGEEYSFWGGDSVDLTDILVNLAYDPARICRCAPEFTVDTEFGTGYGVNLTESYARCEAGQADLTAEQAEIIRGVLARNCGGVTVTQWSWDSGETQTFPVIGGDAAALTELLSSLDYSGWACDCLPEYTVETSGGSYGVNLTERCVRLEDRQAELTEAQAALLTELFARSGVV